MIGEMMRQLAAAAARAAVDRVAAYVMGKVRPKRAEPSERGLTYRDVQHQQAQIRSATAHKVKGPNDGNR